MPRDELLNVLVGRGGGLAGLERLQRAQLTSSWARPTQRPQRTLQLELSWENPWSPISLPSTLGFLRMKLKGSRRNSTTSPSPEGGTWTPLTGKFEWGFWESTATSVLRKTAGRGGGRPGDHPHLCRWLHSLAPLLLRAPVQLGSCQLLAPSPSGAPSL